MQFAVLVFQREEIPQSMSDRGWKAIYEEYSALTRKLEESGRLIGAYGLQSTTETRTVRIRRGETTTANEPFARLDEPLSGITIIEAEDVDEAIRVAEQIPSARWGSVEVRPLKSYADDRKDLAAEVEEASA